MVHVNLIEMMYQGFAITQMTAFMALEMVY